MNEKNKILKAAGGMSLVTSLSRILGYARDALNAALFGAGVISDAFFVAYRIPNMLRELFAEGALSAAFIPALARAKEEAGPEALWNLAAMMLNAVLLFMAVLVLAGVGLAEPLVALLAPGFKQNPEQFELAVLLTRVMFPFIAFMSTGALFMGMLNAHRRFILPAFAPVAMNLVMIGAGLWLCPRMGISPQKQVLGWAIGAVLGGLTQALIQMPAAWRLGFKIVLRWPFREGRVLEVIKQMIPAVLGLSVVQINILVNQNLASQLGSGSISWLYYGNRLMQLPLGVFGVAVATAILPSLAKFSAQKNTAAFSDTLGFGLRLTLLLTLPAAVGIMMLAQPINQLLFMWGQFSAADANAAAAATVAYSVGICFAAWIKLLAPAFYAMQDSRTPVKVAALVVVLNLVLALSLREWLGHTGLALAVSLAAAANAGLLLWLMRRRLSAAGVAPDFELSITVLRAAGATVMMAVVLLVVNQWLGWPPMGGSRLFLGLNVFGRVAAGALTYFVSLRWFGLDLLALWRGARK